MTASRRLSACCDGTRIVILEGVVGTVRSPGLVVLEGRESSVARPPKIVPSRYRGRIFRVFEAHRQRFRLLKIQIIVDQGCCSASARAVRARLQGVDPTVVSPGAISAQSRSRLSIGSTPYRRARWASFGGRPPRSADARGPVPVGVVHEPRR